MGGEQAVCLGSEAGCAPAAFLPRPTLPGTPGLRELGQLPQGAWPPFPAPRRAAHLRRLLEPVPTLCSPSHIKRNFWLRRCPEHCIPEPDHRLNVVTLHLPPALEGTHQPTRPLWGSGVISCGPAQGVVQSHTLSTYPLSPSKLPCTAGRGRAHCSVLPSGAPTPIICWLLCRVQRGRPVTLANC